MNLSGLLGKGLALVRGQLGAASGDHAPGDAQPVVEMAADPGSASTPLIWIVVLLCLIVAGAWIAFAFFGLPSARSFCVDAWQGVSAVLAILAPALLAYRSFNKRTVARVAVTANEATRAAHEATKAVAESAAVQAQAAVLAANGGPKS